MNRDHINPMQWHQAVGFARQSCARIFFDGGKPQDALSAFGLQAAGDADWVKAVDLVAEALCAEPTRRAA